MERHRTRERPSDVPSVYGEPVFPPKPGDDFGNYSGTENSGFVHYLSGRVECREEVNEMMDKALERIESLSSRINNASISDAEYLEWKEFCKFYTSDHGGTWKRVPCPHCKSNKPLELKSTRPIHCSDCGWPKWKWGLPKKKQVEENFPLQVLAASVELSNAGISQLVEILRAENAELRKKLKEAVQRELRLKNKIFDFFDLDNLGNIYSGIDTGSEENWGLTPG